MSIHSARLFVGYQGKLSATTGFITSAEVLANVNRLDDDVGPLDDTRVNATASLTTKVFKNISVRFGVTAKYDNAPVLDPIAMAPLEKLDTKTEAVLVVNFL